MKKKALITGANRGIGYSIAERLYIDGYEIYGTSTTGKEAPKFSSKWFKADFSTLEGINKFIKKLNQISDIDVLVNNAGINIIKSQEDVNINEYDKIQNINLRAPYLIIQHTIKNMRLNSYGRIVNVSSIWGEITKPKRSLYSTMKSGLLGMTRSLAAEYSSDNILINSISPGFVETELTKQSLSLDEKKQLLNQVPIGRFADPTEIAKVVSFLCSESNSYLTGQNIIVDGGFSIT